MLNGESHDRVVLGLVVLDAEDGIRDGILAANDPRGVAIDVAGRGAVGDAAVRVALNGGADDDEGLVVEDARVINSIAIEP